ncbi:hypothetical protein LEMA_P093150.1 [Plenodomus lingam JN3]|uniref:Uncharacterized protein n=1 Tax=Leptosphaeria maculans (strain JN3 / isolate v23.1.3 / race Av1-4-5-6-7-8) TaxID=985895 RepID=E5A2W0_LEPMJ|nr:hypothetical protein LEMA_P093150.1 [Plenodomus lingam JN3]CBX97906.1 hypothetical protein LEMA_P093150.1 [Plenodomus lingam JN3]
MRLPALPPLKPNPTLSCTTATAANIPAARRLAQVHDIKILWEKGRAAGMQGDMQGSKAMERGRNAILTNEFLDFSAARGNNLRQAGLTEGCKWCLCVSRWKEAFEARTGPGDKKVPRVVLAATNERALEKVKVEELRGFAVDE